jgi:hypothetical protein
MFSIPIQPPNKVKKSNDIGMPFQTIFKQEKALEIHQ